MKIILEWEKKKANILWINREDGNKSLHFADNHGRRKAELVKEIREEIRIV